jgi:hypothetical protein
MMILSNRAPRRMTAPGPATTPWLVLVLVAALGLVLPSPVGAATIAADKGKAAGFSATPT